MRLNLLNKAVILSGALLVKASEDVVRVGDDAIEERIGENIWRISDIFNWVDTVGLNNKHIEFLPSVSSYLQELITPGPIPADPNLPLDISNDSKTKLNAISPKDGKLTTFIKDNDGKLHIISEAIDTWFKELLKTAFFNRNLLTAETRKKAKNDGSHTSETIKNEAICSHILSTKPPGWLLMHSCNLILSGFKAIGADSESVIPKIDACLKKIIELLGEASKKTSKYLSKPNNPNWEKNVKKLRREKEEIMLQKQGEDMELLPSIDIKEIITQWFNQLRLWIYSWAPSWIRRLLSAPNELQSSSEILPEISEKSIHDNESIEMSNNVLPEISDEAPILDEQNLETLKTELENLYSENIRPAIDEILSYYYLFLYVSINNANDKKLSDEDDASENLLSDEDVAKYYDLREFIKSLDNFSLLLCDIPKINQRSNIKLKSHMIWNWDLQVLDDYQKTNVRTFAKELHEENGGNTLYIDLSKALKKFDDFKKAYTEDLNDQHGTPRFGYRWYDYSSIIENLANHLLYINYNVTKEMLKEKWAIKRIEQNISKLDYFIKSSNIMHSNITIEEQKGHIKEFCNDTGMFEVDALKNFIININDETKRNPTDFLRNDKEFDSKLKIAESDLMAFLQEQNANYEKTQKDIDELKHGTKRTQLQAAKNRFPIDSNNLSFLLLSSEYYPCGGLNYLFYSILKVFESIGADCDVLLDIKFCLKTIIEEMVNTSDECVELDFSVPSYSNDSEVLEFNYKPDALSKIISYYQVYLYAELEKCSTNKLDDGLISIYRDLYYQIYTLDAISRLLLNIKLSSDYENYIIKESTALCMFDRMAYVWKHNLSNIYHSVNDLNPLISANQLLAKVDEFAKMYSSSIEELDSITTSQNLESDLSKDICRLSRGLMHITRGIIEQENALESEKDKMDN